MSTELTKTYNPKEVEDRIYRLWEQSGFFSPEKTKKSGIKGLFQKKFIVTIPPPNITGELHMGHALENTLTDIIVRMKRMQGYQTLWVPGIDHAGIATQNVVEKQLAKEGLTRYDLGREKFLELIWQWKKKYGSRILNQFKKLGLSIDWSRIRFTMDENYKKSVNAAFFHYWKRGWIYQGKRVINWCPRCQTAISDLEVEYKETAGKLYYIKYPLAEPKSGAEDSKNYIVVATTRPETMLGDTAVAVHPDDERYKNLISEKVVLPIQNKLIPVVSDNSVDMNFGTGAVKVTPAHSVADFEIGQRHKLTSVEIINKQGKMTSNAGQICNGLTIFECRQKVVEKLKELNLLEKVEDFSHNVGYCERCGTIIEPLISKQWFLKMKPLAKLAKKALAKGLVKFYPNKWEKPYIKWLDNIRDWNISRQIWWGHRLPIWFHEPICMPKPEKEKEMGKCIKIIASEKEPKCKYCNAKYKQSEDVLDTWFSSALWPFAVFYWPNKNHSDYKRFYPTQFMYSGREIFYLWIVRMIFSGMELTGKSPFKDIYIHPTVLTKDGKRMSKSLGTGIDPLKLIEKYGTDALRFGLAFQTTGIQDMRFNEDVIDMGKKFANKIWNATRFCLNKISNQSDGKKDYELKLPGKLDNMDMKFIKEIKELTRSVTRNIESFKFGKAANDTYHFFWDKFASIYIEDSKSKLNNKESAENKKQVLLWLLANQIKLLHPFMPFITEEIWSKLPIKNKKPLIMETWPD